VPPIGRKRAALCTAPDSIRGARDCWEQVAVVGSSSGHYPEVKNIHEALHELGRLKAELRAEEFTVLVELPQRLGAIPFGQVD